MNRDSPIVVDTHALIWHLEGSPKLSREATLALRSIERGERGGIVPSIVLAELIHIAEKGRTTLDAAETISEIGDSSSFGLAPLDLDVLELMIDLAIPELHDRIIVATALSYGARLITQDRQIRESGLVECVW